MKKEEGEDEKEKEEGEWTGLRMSERDQKVERMKRERNL